LKRAYCGLRDLQGFTGWSGRVYVDFPQAGFILA
jgi:hypothetical protein